MRRIVLILGAVALLLAGCVAEGRLGATVVTGGAHAIRPGAILDGHLVLVDGQFSVAHGATIRGSAFVTGGELRLLGRLDGDLSVLGGALALGPGASIGGDLRVAGGAIDRDPSSVVEGEIVSGVDAKAALGLVQPRQPSPSEQLIRFGLQALLLAGLAAVVARWWPRSTARVGAAVRERPLLALALGLLGVLVGLPLAVFMAFTVVLIPLALVLVLGYGLVLAYAWAALGLQLGRRINARSGRLSTPVRQAVGGTLLLTIAAGIIGLVPWVGDALIIATLLACIGAALLTRLGFSDAPRRADV